MNTHDGNGAFGSQSTLARDLKRVLVGTALILLLPLVAMQFTAEVKWTAGDFVVAGLLLAGTGSACVLLLSRVRGMLARRAVAGGFFLTLLLVWAELAVGVFGTPLAGS